MSRALRFLPDKKDGVLVEVSSRMVNAWALMRPSAELSDVTVGVLGRSLEISPVELVAVCFLSNHAKSPDVRDELWGEFRIFQLKYGEAARALLSGELVAAWDFPKGSYPPALPFIGKPAPPPPPPPPTREVTETESGTVQRGEVPVVEIAGRWQAAEPQKPQAREEPRARGQPP